MKTDNSYRSRFIMIKINIKSNDQKWAQTMALSDFTGIGRLC